MQVLVYFMNCFFCFFFDVFNQVFVILQTIDIIGLKTMPMSSSKSEAYQLELQPQKKNVFVTQLNDRDENEGKFCNYKFLEYIKP